MKITVLTFLVNQKNVEVNWGVSFRDYTEKDLQSRLVVKSFSSSNLKVSLVLLLVFVWYGYQQGVPPFSVHACSYYCVFLNLAPTILDKNVKSFAFSYPQNAYPADLVPLCPLPPDPPWSVLLSRGQY